MKVFEELRDAFRQAVENFKVELHRDEVPDRVDVLLEGMRRKIVETEALVRRLEDEVRRANAHARRELEEAETCRRREALAAKIGDAETARIAAEFAAKHEERRRVLERKAAALEEERSLRRREADEMRGRLSDARSRRDTLSAAAGRTQARESLDGADALFAELDRMSERIEDDALREEVRRTMAEGDEAGGPSRILSREEADREAEARAAARLDALKRRMDADERD